ncbi:unnamed protein product [Victoria cruziana]
MQPKQYEAQGGYEEEERKRGRKGVWWLRTPPLTTRRVEKSPLLCTPPQRNFNGGWGDEYQDVCRFLEKKLKEYSLGRRRALTMEGEGRNLHTTCAAQTGD